MTEYINRQWRLPNVAEGNFKDYSMSFSSGQYISLQNSPNLINFNISFWMKVDSYSSEITAIGSNGVSGFTFESATSLRVKVGNTNYSWSPGWTLTTGEWQHIVFSRDENNLITAFRNGVHYTANAPTTGGSYFNANFIGRLGSATGTFIGEIAELAYFEHNLSQSNINALYNDGQPGDPMAISPTPLRYYKLGNSLFDGGYLVPNQANEETVLNFSNFTGSYGVVRAATNQDFNDIQKFTFCGWIKFNNVPGKKHVFAIDDAIFPHTQRIDINVYNGSLRFNVNYPTGSGASINNITTSTPSVENNQWFHYSGVFDGTFTDSDINVQNAGRLKLYLNAVPQTVTIGSGPGIASSTGSLALGSETVVGGFLNGTFPGFNGPATNIQLFDDALTPSEILTVYNGGVPLTDVNNIPKINNLKVWYKLDGNNSIWNNEDTEWKVDNSKNPSNYRSSLSFDGNDDYIDFGNNDGLQLTSSFTLSAWVRLTSLASGQSAAIISKGTVGGSDRSVSLYLSNSGGYIYPHIAISEDGSSWELNAVGGTGVWNGAFGPWHNVTATFNGSTEAKLYVNGVPVATDTASSFTPISTSSSFRIGLDAENDNDLNGKVSNVSVFNTVLPETGSNSIETLYNNGTPLADVNSFSSLVAWWKLNNTTTGIGNSLSNYRKAVNFNYLNTDYLSLGTMSTLSAEAEVTFSIWAKITKPGGTQGFSMIYTDNSDGGTGNKGTIYIDPSGYNARVKCTLRNTSSLMTPYFNHTIFNSWNNITVTFGTTYAKLYLNGQLQDTEAVGTAANLGVNAFLGRYSSTSPVYATGGLLSNFAIFNSELSGPQVLTLFNGGTPETSISFSPVHHWKLNDINTGLNDIGSLASNNATRGAAAPGTVGSGPTTALAPFGGTNNGATSYNGFVNTLAGDSENMNQQNLVKNGLTTTEIYSPYALAFDGNDYIDCGNDSIFQFQAADSFSVSAWVNINSVTGNADFIVSNGLWNTSPYSGWGLNLQGANILRFDLTDNNVANQLSIDSSGITLNNNTWYHVLFTYDGSNSTTGMNFYLDGLLTSKTIVANNALGAITYTSSMKLNIGARESGVRPFNGDISNVSIFDSALTQAQVTEIYNKGLPSNLNSFSGTAPIAWWQLGSNSSWTSPSWTVSDEVGINNGTSYNMLENAVTNGVGDPNYAVGANMSLGNNISGSYPNGSSNCLSVNMGINSRSSDYNN